MQAAMQQVEEACADFQVSPPYFHFQEPILISLCFSKVPSTRAAAEAILSQFRETPRVLPLCQFILGSQRDRSFRRVDL